MASGLELDNKPFLQLILILSLCLISVILFSIIGIGLSIALYDFSPNSYYNLAQLQEHQIAGFKILQLFSAIGLFLVPPMVYGLISSKKPFKKLSLNKLNKPINYILIFFLMVISTPFISWIIELNANMVLPDFLSGLEQWMRNSEDKAGEMTMAFLTFDGLGSLFYILIIVAIVPALGEELLFRGVLQKIFINWTKNPHIGIWITSILFSALHMQFFGFFPRLLLGLMFGYVFWWSKSLWIPILGHFINNGSVVIVSYFYPDIIKETDISIFNDNENSFLFYMLSFIISVFIFYIIRKVNQNIRHSMPDTEFLNQQHI
jgi:membrane protease YdiL (CAAX protease family)